MTWFRIDDSFYDHPKVFDAPDCAVALWTRAGTWAARNLTDGFVPSGMPARLCDDPDTAVRELTRRGLWKRTTGGFQFHDWSEFQPTAEAVKTLRQQRVEAGRRGGTERAARLREAVDNSAVDRRNRSETENRADGRSRRDESLGASRESATSGFVANAKQVPSKSQASASPVAKQNATPTRPVPKGRGGTGDLQGDQAVTRAREAPPPDRCEKHAGVEEPPPCGACADARKTRERWESADADRRRTQAQCRQHRGQPADRCGLCRSEALGGSE